MDPITSRLERLALENQIKACGDAIEEQEEVIHNLRFIHDFIGKFGLDEASLAILNENGQLSELLNIPEDELGSTGVTIVQEGLLDKIKDKVKEKIAAWKARMKKQNDRLLSRNDEDLKKFEKAIKDFAKLDKTGFTEEPLSNYPASYYKTKIDTLLKLFPIILGNNLSKKHEGYVWFDFTQVKKDIEFLLQTELDINTSTAPPIKWYLGWDDERKPDYMTHEDRWRAKHGYKANSTHGELGWTPEIINKFCDQWKHLSAFVKESSNLDEKIINLRHEHFEVSETHRENGTMTKEINRWADAANSTLNGIEQLFELLCDETHQILTTLMYRMVHHATRPNNS